MQLKLGLVDSNLIAYYAYDCLRVRISFKSPLQVNAYMVVLLLLQIGQSLTGKKYENYKNTLE